VDEDRKCGVDMKQKGYTLGAKKASGRERMMNTERIKK